eukprot:m.261441 g.261441  ORF g.261441 m.261441 type:complete len:216 (+) comp26782_c1_seq9:3217-3864(+)
MHPHWGKIALRLQNLPPIKFMPPLTTVPMTTPRITTPTCSSRIRSRSCRGVLGTKKGRIKLLYVCCWCEVVSNKRESVILVLILALFKGVCGVWLEEEEEEEAADDRAHHHEGDHHLAVAAHLHLVVVARLHLAVRAAHQDVAVPLLHAGLQRHKQCWGEGRGGVMLCCMVVWLCVLCLCVAACAVFVCVWLCVLNDAKTSVKVDIQQMNVESIK